MIQIVCLLNRYYKGQARSTEWPIGLSFYWIRFFIIVSGTSQILISSIAQVNVNSHEIPGVILESYWSHTQTSDDISGTEQAIIDSNLFQLLLKLKSSEITSGFWAMPVPECTWFIYHSLCEDRLAGNVTYLRFSSFSYEFGKVIVFNSSIVLLRLYQKYAI